jgi:hypothetical protein
MIEMKTIFFCFLVLGTLAACHSKRVDAKESTMVPAIESSSIKDDFKITDPSAKEITVVFYSPAQGRAMLNIYSSDGKIFEQRQLEVNKGLNTWDCYCQIKSAGTYIVRFSMDTIERSARVFKALS